jgi:demethylmenaquinone methyltransferase / 2-methoxy-6-polyprenyl-1,4-benzoquinol methylase
VGNQQMSSPSREHVAEMFDQIAHRYDLLNRLLSFGRDIAWRKQFVKQLPAANELRVLDLATGTADVLLTLGRDARIGSGAGLDMSTGMLRYAAQKLTSAGYAERFPLVLGDAGCLGIQSGQFDVVTISFGIRNVSRFEEALREMHRVLKPGGHALIMEFSIPANPYFRPLYLFYLRHILPRLGGLLSGDPYAYRYLNQTIETFPYGAAFCEIMKKTGFTEVESHPLTFGIATLYAGHK